MFDADMDYVCSIKKQNVIFLLVFALLTSSIVLLLTLTNIVSLTFASTSGNSSVWTEGEKMPTARTELMADAVDDKIYVLGGVDYSKNYQFRKVEVYDTKTNQWHTIKPMPQSLDHGAAVAYDGKIYVPGGFAKGKVPTDKLFIYDLKTKLWQEGKPLLSPRGALTAQIINGTLYVIGGVNASQVPVNTVDAYDLSSGTWSEKKSMPTARHHLESVALDGKLYVMGGRILGDGVASEDMDESLTNYDKVEMYDPQKDTWTTKSPMLEKRSGFAVTSANGQIFVFGGEGVKNDLSTVEKYNPATDKWSHEPSMPSERIGLEAVNVGDKIYVIGGQIASPKSGLVALDKNEIFNINTQQNNVTAPTINH